MTDNTAACYFVKLPAVLIRLQGKSPDSFAEAERIRHVILRGVRVDMPDEPVLRRTVSPFASLIGLRPEADKGILRCLLDIEDKHLNVNGTVHGGVISTLADVSMGWQVFQCLSHRESVATVEMKINYFSPVSSGTLVAEASLLHKSRKLAVLESTITSGDQLVAKATATFYLLPARVS